MHEIFGTKHIIILAVSIACIVFLSLLFKNLKKEKVFKIMMIVGIISEVVKVFYYIITNEDVRHGYLPETDLPFHLCSIQILFFIYLNVSKNEKGKQKVLSFMLPTCLLGGFAAILLATDSSRNGLFIITIEYFVYHALLVVFSIYLYINKEIKFTIKDYFTSLIFLLTLGFIAIYLNGMLQNGNTNFMYVVRPPEDNLPYLTIKYGWLVYIVHYFMLAIILITLAYIKPIIDYFKNRKVNNDIA